MAVRGVHTRTIQWQDASMHKQCPGYLQSKGSPNWETLLDSLPVVFVKFHQCIALVRDGVDLFHMVLIFFGKASDYQTS
jgi:hypothetical protein